MDWPKSLKKTDTRLRVFEVLKRANQPMSAEDIVLALQHNGGGICLSTVYRVLYAFEVHLMASKITAKNFGTARYTLADHPHRHYATCVVCHRCIPLSECPLEHYVPVLAEDGFVVLGHNLEIYGRCRYCIGDNATRK
jgi:Fur family ferric uptake transcriptional regulator